MGSVESVTRLQSISPSNVLADKALLAIYCHFLKRGTLSECCQLLIECFGAQDLFTCVQNLQTPPQSARVAPQQSHQPRVADDTTPHKAIPNEATPHKATPHHTHNDTESHNNVEEFFKKQFPHSQDIRINRLVRVARRIAKSKKINILEQSGASGDFIFKDEITQATTIYRTIEESSDRMYRLYFANAVELYTLSVISEASRDMKKNVALNHITAVLKVDRQKVIDIDNEGNKYLTFMEVGGAASLYSIDGARTDIEKLNNEEIFALCEYRRAQTPRVEEASRNADVEVAKSIRKHLRALGCKDADISSGNTRLTRIIGRPHRNKKGMQPNESIHQSNSNEQLYSGQTVPRSSDQRSMITTSAENSTIFHLEDPSIPKRTSKKRKRENLKEHGRTITSNIESSTPWRTSIPESRHDGVTAQAGGQHFLADIPSHMEQRADITSCLEEGRNMQHGDIMDLDNVVDAYETLREAEVEERQRTDNCAEQSQTPVFIADSVVADNDSFYSPRPSGQDGPEHSRSPSLLSPPSPEVINSSATALMVGSGKESPLAGSTRQSLPPCNEMITFNEPTTDVDWSSTNVKETRAGQRVGDTSNLQGTTLEANSNCDRQSPIYRSPSLPTPELGSELDDQATGLSSYLGVEDVNETWPDYMSGWYRE